jgi:hypothetical protein
MLVWMTPAMPPPGFDDLSPNEKLDYINALWERFTAQPEDVPMPEWHREVIAERVAAAGEGSARPWDAVRKDLRLAAAIDCYRRGLASQGRAAELAGVSRTELIDALAAREIDVFQVDVEEFLRPA